MSLEEMKEAVLTAAKNGGWLVLAGHEIGNAGYQTTEAAVLEQFLKYANDPANGIWLDTVDTIARYIQTRRTGQRLNVRGGARMGWITGVISCALLTLLFAFFMLAIRQMGGLDAIKDGLKDFAFQQASVDEALKMLQDPSRMLRSLIATFVMLTLTCAAGGPLGAKILSKD
jgi:hypothetical protein